MCVFTKSFSRKSEARRQTRRCRRSVGDRQLSRPEHLLQFDHEVVDFPLCVGAQLPATAKRRNQRSGRWRLNGNVNSMQTPSTAKRALLPMLHARRVTSVQQSRVGVTWHERYANSERDILRFCLVANGQSGESIIARVTATIKPAFCVWCCCSFVRDSMNGCNVIANRVFRQWLDLYNGFATNRRHIQRFCNNRRHI